MSAQDVATVRLPKRSVIPAQIGLIGYTHLGLMIEVTRAAAKRIREAMATEGVAKGGLRVGVKAGGCNGMSYVFQWEAKPRSDDEVFESSEGTRIFVDKKSYKYLNGTVLDCDSAMLGQSLVFRNPNASSECGCGLSFNV